MRPIQLNSAALYWTPGVTQRVLDRRRLRNDADRRAVLGRGGEQVVGGAQAAAAGHGLRDDGRLARDVPAEEARDQAAVIVVGAAGTEADVEIDGLALEELIGALRRDRLRQQRSAAAIAAAARARY